MILLHVLTFTGNHRTTDAMPGAPRSPKETQRVAIDAPAFACRHRRAVTVGDAFVRQRNCFTFLSQLTGCICIKLLRVIEIEVRDVARHQLGVGKPRKRVFSRKSSDVAGRLHRVPHCSRTAVGSARIALALSEIDCDTEAALTRELDRLDRAHARCHAEPGVIADTHLSRICALAASLSE